MSAIAIMAGSGPAAAFEFEDIFGTWCGDRDNPTWVNYRFTRERLYVTALPSRSEKAFEVVRYEFDDPDVVVLYYRGADTKTGGTPGDKVTFNVKFGHFSSDRETMRQERSSAGDVYFFKRCNG